MGVGPGEERGFWRPQSRGQRESSRGLGHYSLHGSFQASQGLGFGCTGPTPQSDPTTLDSFCKGRTLHSFVRDPKTSLDINKTRQIAQEIIKVKGYPTGSRVPGHPPGPSLL